MRRELTRVRRSKSPPALHYSPPPRPQSPPPPKMLHIPPPPLSVPHKTSLKHPVSHMPQTGQKNKPKVYGWCSICFISFFCNCCYLFQLITKGLVFLSLRNHLLHFSTFSVCKRWAPWFGFLAVFNNCKSQNRQFKLPKQLCRFDRSQNPLRK